jgi:hypothetical protein
VREDELSARGSEKPREEVGAVDTRTCRVESVDPLARRAPATAAAITPAAAKSAIHPLRLTPVACRKKCPFR